MLTTCDVMGAVLQGPQRGAIVLGSTSFDLAEVGYVAEEYHLEGEATSYTLQGARTDDGRWTLNAAARAPYVTRLVVYRPSDAKAFSGTVLLEWINVSPSSDVAPMWYWIHREAIRAGHMWIGLSVQRAGIEGGGFYPGPVPPLKKVDPARYGNLHLPGDAWSFDIFSQGARLVREQAGKEFLPGYRPQRLLALGASQSAMFMVAYINGLGPVHRLFDGYLLSGRIGTCASFDGVVPADDAGIRIRDDLGVPTITVQSEADVVGKRASFHARQPDDDRTRLWEIAGASHMDTYNLAAGAIDSGRLPVEVLARALAPVDRLVGLDLGRLVNSGPQQHYVLQAALAHLVRWVAGGAPPPSADRLRVLQVDPPRFEIDDLGHARGGIRSPWVDVPRSRLSGVWRADVPPPLSMFGVTEPFDREQLARLYQNDAAYLQRFDAALERAATAGFILAADQEEIRALARWSVGAK